MKDSLDEVLGFRACRLRIRCLRRRREALFTAPDKISTHYRNIEISRNYLI